MQEIKLKKWETREGRESGKKRPYEEAARPRKPARVVHHFPNETVYVNAEQKRADRSQLRSQRPGMVGIVERGDFPDKRILAGYLAEEERDGQFVHVHLSPEEGFYEFLVLEGKIVREPDNVSDKGNYFTFRNHPDPIYHRTFKTPRDREDPSRTFEHHCRRLAGNRIMKMVEGHVRQEEIRRYRAEIDEFLKLSGELFKKYNQF